MNLRELQLGALREIYDAELQAAEALPRMARATSSPDLGKAFEDHTAVTKRQAQRLEDLFRRMEVEPERKESKDMRGFATEADELIRRDEMDPEFRDAVREAA